MLTFRLDIPTTMQGAKRAIDPAARVTAVLTTEQRRAERDAGTTPDWWVTRNDFPTMAVAEHVAGLANDAAGKPGFYIAIDNGANVSPRFDVIEAPAVGWPVSYSFNGDSYPDGEIVRVGTGVRMTVTTSTGSRFYRSGQSGRWVKEGGTWSLRRGHHDERNPCL